MRWLRNNRGNLGSLFGGGKKSNPYSSIQLPSFQVDSSYQKSQDTLSNLGENVLSGNVPDYYKPIGDFNSDAFKQLINNVSGQINQGAQENAAISGVGRSGTAQAAAAGAMSNVLPQLQYQDYNRAVQGRAGLLDFGANVESGVRSAGQAQEGLLNNFNLKNFQNQINLTGATDRWNQEYAGQQGAAVGNTVGAIGSLALAPFTGGASLAGLPGFASASFGGGNGGGGGGIGSLLSFLKPQSGGNLGGFGGLSSPSSKYFNLNIPDLPKDITG